MNRILPNEAIFSRHGTPAGHALSNRRLAFMPSLALKTRRLPHLFGFGAHGPPLQAVQMRIRSHRACGPAHRSTWFAAMRLKLTISYDGRPYNGWQSQACGNTVQDFILRALEEVAKHPVKLQGAGRTDTGVHALGQIAHFDAPAEISMNPCNWVPALNSKLPATIRIMACEEVAEDFHSRFSASGKIYHYDICTDPVLPPLKAGLAWHLPRLLDASALEQALAGFTGRHDFHAFAAYRGNETPGMDWCRTLHRADLETHCDGYRITYVGDGFLYKMVRLLTGAAVHAAQGRMRIEDLAALLDQPPGLPRGKAPNCAPADGLYLQEVLYGKPAHPAD
jgi:tRNA pseudouridine38-40 synthase